MKFPAARFVHWLSLLLLCSTASLMGAENAYLSIDASKAGAKIDRNLFGQFAENLGHGLYEGIWVGPDSPIPNTRGIRNDVVTALQALKVPNVRWPGGCFADEYHWRNGIGPAGQRPATINAAWGDVVDTNSFGTHEFMDFLQQIGSEAYVSVNVGSGTPREAAEWSEYLTAAQPTALAKERAANGHRDPYKVGFLGIGNESWGCGGNIAQMINVLQSMIFTDKEKMVLTPTYYVYKIYVPFEDATFLPVAVDAGRYTQGTINLPRVDALAARDSSGKLWLEITNLDPEKPVEINAEISGRAIKSAKAETLTASAVDSVNTFAAPNTVVPKPIAAKIEGSKLALTVGPKSVTVISLEP
jgi:alpha-L-arabinofuranosidase